MGIRTLRSHWDVISGSLRSAQQAVSSPKQSDNEVEAVLLKAGPSSEDAGPCSEDAGPSSGSVLLPAAVQAVQWEEGSDSCSQHSGASA